MWCLDWKVRRIHAILDFTIWHLSAMCCENVASFERVTPRSRTCCFSWMVELSLLVYVVSSCVFLEVLLVYLISSNLSQLNNILLSSDHLYIELRSVWRRVVSIGVAMPFPTLVSSAKDDRKASATSLSMSPMRTRKRSGPRTEPWGTPETTGLGVDFLPFITTVWVLLVRNVALAKSRYMTSTPLPFSSSVVILSKWLRSWLRHDLPLQNPC